LMMSLSSEGQILTTNQILLMYLNPVPRFNYFRFGNTNIRHIGIILPFAMLTKSQ